MLVGSVKAKCKCPKTIKVAILLSQVTYQRRRNDSYSFKGRKNTIFIGERTCGLTTGVRTFIIDSYLLGLAASFSIDRNGKIYNGPVSPDVEIIEGDVSKI